LDNLSVFEDLVIGLSMDSMIEVGRALTVPEVGFEDVLRYRIVV
jgi:hypothetical protein